MTQDEIIEMAKKSNLLGVIDCFHYTGRQTWVEEATAFAKLVDAKATAKEREACAKVCDKFNWGQAPKMIQDAIRARGEA